MAIDLDRIKTAATALMELSRSEYEFLQTYLAASYGKRAGRGLDKLNIPLRGDKPERVPDPRGRFKCSICDKILPTKRGRALHENMHDRQTAPAPATKETP